MQPRGPSYGWLWTAIGVSVALILGAPFIGQLRSALRSAAGPYFVTVMAAVVVVSAAAAIGFALFRITGRRLQRYLSLGGALLIAIGYSLAASTGNPEVDAVERFHFIEYGLITALFYRAWRPVGDGSLLVMPVLAGLVTGTLEEWLQWFIPVRVGEVRDVLLNLFAIASGLLFSLGLDPPAPLVRTLQPESRRTAARVAAVGLVLFAGFVHSVHLGHEIRDPDAGVFRSRYTAAELAAIGESRAALWKSAPPVTWSRLSREDQYFSEGAAHVRRRNEMWSEGNVMAARLENLILEKYYAPVLDTPSYLSAVGLRWPAAQRADAESRVGPDYMIYDSDALDYPVVTWSKWAYWSVVAALVLIVLRFGR
jgi:VanZ family protein